MLLVLQSIMKESQFINALVQKTSWSIFRKKNQRLEKSITQADITIIKTLLLLLLPLAS